MPTSLRESQESIYGLKHPIAGDARGHKTTKKEKASRFIQDTQIDYISRNDERWHL
jgi:hypothetical protein